ncbi:uncharacterized protein LOC143856003 [Tasmannia lanceolata]|uniref:uncharacterized protein LOC143856003 n=1 Tax=Tasmannia lanceolata TaxID=3420 RepID=UPI004063DB2E
MGHRPDPFVEFLKEEGIVAQYSMPGTPQQNGVAEKRNHTLMDMVRRSKGYKFYCPNHTIKFVEGRNDVFLDDDDNSGSEPPRDQLIGIHDPPRDVVMEDGPIDGLPPQVDVVIENANQNPQEVEDVVAPRRSSRIRKPAISSYYIVYLQEVDQECANDGDPLTFSQAMSGEDSNLWHEAMRDELESMAKNQVWDLVELPKGANAIGCKWAYKIKRDSAGNNERYKERLVAKGFTQKEGIDSHETFLPVSKKDTLRIIIALVAHFDLELHQMNVKTAFLNGSLEEEVYMSQPDGFRRKMIVIRIWVKPHMSLALRFTEIDLKVYVRPDIRYAARMLGRYQNNSRMDN